MNKNNYIRSRFSHDVDMMLANTAQERLSTSIITNNSAMGTAFAIDQLAISIILFLYLQWGGDGHARATGGQAHRREGHQD